MINMDGRLFVGTSGFSYDHWVGTYYPSDLAQRDRLSFYARDFSTVEINATFYRLQKVSTYEHWKRITPESFRFALKGSRYITHIKRLRGAGDALKRFYAPTSELGNKFAVTLWQTPANLSKDLSVLSDFIEATKEEAPKGVLQAFEFRNSEWLDQKTYTLLDESGCGIVIADSDSYPVVDDIVCGGIFYVRFHGRASDGLDYTKNELNAWAEKISRRVSEGNDVYAYFNNDTKAYAANNAKYLISSILKR